MFCRTVFGNLFIKFEMYISRASTNACMRPRRAVDAQRHAAQVPAHVVLERGRAAQGQACRVPHAARAHRESAALVVPVGWCAARDQGLCAVQGGRHSREHVHAVVRQRGGAAAAPAATGVDGVDGGSISIGSARSALPASPLAPSQRAAPATAPAAAARAPSHSRDECATRQATRSRGGPG